MTTKTLESLLLDPWLDYLSVCKHVHPDGSSAVKGKMDDEGFSGVCQICGEVVES